MALLTSGYWQARYWAKGYWVADYWAEYKLVEEEEERPYGGETVVKTPWWEYPRLTLKAQVKSVLELAISGTACSYLVHTFSYTSYIMLPKLKARAIVSRLFNVLIVPRQVKLAGVAVSKFRPSIVDEVTILGLGDIETNTEEEEFLLGVSKW